MKKLLGWLCAFLLLLLPIISAQSEETDGDQTELLAVFYLHATKDDELIKTAKYVICALDVNKGTRDIVIDRVDDAKKRLVYNKADSNSLDSLINKKEKLSDGTEPIRNTDLLAKLLAEQSDIWMIVPQEACGNLVQNQGMMDQFEELLEDPELQIHLVLIGDDVKAPDGDTALAQLAAFYPGQVEIIRITSDFLAQNRAANADGTVHTGDYFLASFFGKPVDLVPEQKDDNKWTISLPEPGNIFILQRHTGEVAEPVITDEQDKSRMIQQYISLEYPSKKNDGTCFTGSLLTQLPAGSYDLADCSGEIKVYWYPNQDKLQPIFDMGGESWVWGRHKVSLSIGDALYRPKDFYVVFSTAINDNPLVDNIPEYNPENKLWELELETKTDVKKIEITPKVILRMKDGNQIWSWDSEHHNRILESAGSSARKDAPSEVILYFTDENGGTFTGQWNDFFDYSDYEEQTFGAEASGNVENSIIIRTDATGFSLEAVPGMPGEGTVILKCGESMHELKVVWKDVRDIFDGIEFSDNAASGYVQVGKEVELKARIYGETSREWQTAASQLIGFPNMETLKLNGWIAGKRSFETETAEGQIFTEKNEELSATVSVAVPDNYPAGELLLTCQVIDAIEESDEIISKDLIVRVRNSNPQTVKDFTEKTDVILKGIPGKYEAKEFLLETLGTGNLFELFTDDETEIKEIIVSVSNPVGLSENNKPLEETGETWQAIVSDPKSIPSIMVDAPGDHILTLTASDGVYRSAPISIKVHVYSKVLQIVMYVGAALTVAILLLVLILVIRRICKPQFGDIQLRCMASIDENAERSREILNECLAVPMESYGKNPVSLTDLLILARQPDMGAAVTEATDDIILLPTKHSEVNVFFGKKAMERIGRHEKRDLIKQNSMYRLRIDSYYIWIEKVQG